MSIFEYVFWNKNFVVSKKKKKRKNSCFRFRSCKSQSIHQQPRLFAHTTNTCNVNTQQTFPKHLFKTVSMILLFLCIVNVPLALNCFKDAGLLFYQSDGNDSRQHLRDAACCNLLILLFVFQLICKFLKY